MVQEGTGGTKSAFVPCLGPGLLLPSTSQFILLGLRFFSTDGLIHPQDTEEQLGD